ncbi:hypothetical protein BBFGKLBO_03026 [Synechococcus sp. CBW1107]|nr:hypothetical protein BBFGKLBO_03026 [Synechococcus sp. CBW1107]
MAYGSAQPHQLPWKGGENLHLDTLYAVRLNYICVGGALRERL